jgi:signal transduction histidine kinase
VEHPDPLGVLGHEVRNLIATFVGFTELLLSHDWPPEKQREYLETMRNEGVRVSQFLNELLDLQRMEGGATTPQLRPTDLGALLRFAAEVAAHDPTHPIELELPQDLPLALAEPDRVQQVLANLLSNARKYSPFGGRIRLSARMNERNELEVSVQDSGVGIPPDALEHVFDKFFRVESLAHRDIRGTGLGLTISRQIIEAHGGRIWAESAGIGRGATVTFSLALAPASAPAPEAVGAGARLSSRGEHLAAHQRHAGHAGGLSRPTAAQPSWGSRIGLFASDRQAADG